VPPLLDPVIDEAIQRLAAEFAGQASARTVAAFVRRSCHDLDACPLRPCPN